MTTEEVEALAKRIAAQVIQDLGRVQARALSYRQAARELGISERHVRRMAKSGELLTCEIGRRQLVPRSEVERLVRPNAPARRPTKGRPRANGYDPKAEVEKARAARRSKSRED